MFKKLKIVVVMTGEKIAVTTTSFDLPLRYVSFIRLSVIVL